MNKLFLYYFFISAFLALVLVAAYSLLLAGAKYNGEKLSPEGIYDRAKNGAPVPTPNLRRIDSDFVEPSELDQINQQNSQYQQMPVESPSSSPNYGSDGVPYIPGN